jgi:uncharacterized protein (TIGR02246 family)
MDCKLISHHKIFLYSASHDKEQYQQPFTDYFYCYSFSFLLLRYEFTMGATGDIVKARYTFFYVQDQTTGEWLILHHHSSQMPEEVGPIGKKIEVNEVRNLFYLWNDALATLDPEVVANRYSRDAVLLPTVSDIPRTSHETIEEYFVNFLQKKPQGTILESYVQIGNNYAKDSGIYEFEMGAENGKKVKARYTFVYVFEDGQWKILHQHSSQMPEEIQPKGTNESKKELPVLPSDEVRGLFKLWNDALATLDPKIVAKRYAKQPILLPTVSDTPRMTEESIIDYFTTFLQKQPQGVIIDGQTFSAPGFCEDAGVYEFSMGADGSKVLGRYSFMCKYSV